VRSFHAFAWSVKLVERHPPNGLLFFYKYYTPKSRKGQCDIRTMLMLTQELGGATFPHVLTSFEG